MSARSPQLHIWLDGEPGVSPPSLSIDDVPGESDRSLIAAAIVEGRLGRYLPARIRYSTATEPAQRQVQSLDTPKFLQEHAIRHRRRYEVVVADRQDDANHV